MALLRDEPEKVPLPRVLVGLDDVPRGEVAAPHVEHLALLDEDLHRLPDLVPGRVAVDVVHLVKVDAVGLEAPQAVVAGAADVVRAEAAAVRDAVVHRAVDLRREDDAVAPPATLGRARCR